jgi:hypothetical protein
MARDALLRVPSLEAALDMASTSAASTFDGFSPVGSPVRSNRRPSAATDVDAARVVSATVPPWVLPKGRPDVTPAGCATGTAGGGVTLPVWWSTCMIRCGRVPGCVTGVDGVVSQADVVAAAALVTSRVENAKARAAAKVSNAKTARERAIITAQVSQLRIVSRRSPQAAHSTIEGVAGWIGYRHGACNTGLRSGCTVDPREVQRQPTADVTAGAVLILGSWSSG